LRILAVGNLYPPHSLGGYEIVWQAAMREARSRGHEVEILTTGHRERGVEREDEPGVHRELQWYWEDHEWRQLGPYQRLSLERANRAVLERHLGEFRPDVVSFWAMGGMSLSLIEQIGRRRLAAVLVPHDDWLVYGPRVDGWMRLWSGRRRSLGRVAAALVGVPTEFRRQRSEVVLTNSQFILNRARAEGYRLANASVIPPGVDSGFLASVAPSEWAWRLLYVGRIDRRKWIDLAVAALAELPREATLTIAGSGDRAYEAELRSQIAREGLGTRVTFAGQVGRDGLPAVYAGADVVLFPVRWEEPFGLVPLEAMGIGRPVIATARGGAAEYLEDGTNALVVPSDDSRSIRDAVERLAADPALRQRLTAGGRATAAANTAQRFENRIVNAHERAARLPTPQ
jgi:glycogen synthase